MNEAAFLFRTFSRSLSTELQVAVMRGMQHWTTSPLKEELAYKKVLMVSVKSNVPSQSCRRAFLKLINNSPSSNKENHDRDGVWISDHK